MYEIATNATFQDHVRVEALEKQYFAPEVIASAQTTWGWSQANDEGLFLLRRKEQPQEVLGHLSAFPIRKEIAALLAAGEMKDTDIAPDAILPYSTALSSDLYFAVICVEKAHRRQGVRLLFAAFLNLLESKLAQNSLIDFIYAEAGTRDGQRILQRRGFQKCLPERPIPCFYKAKAASVLSAFAFLAEE